MDSLGRIVSSAMLIKTKKHPPPLPSTQKRVYIPLLLKLVARTGVLLLLAVAR